MYTRIDAIISECRTVNLVSGGLIVDLMVNNTHRHVASFTKTQFKKYGKNKCISFAENQAKNDYRKKVNGIA